MNYRTAFFGAMLATLLNGCDGNVNGGSNFPTIFTARVSLTSSQAELNLGSGLQSQGAASSFQSAGMTFYNAADRRFACRATQVKGPDDPAAWVIVVLVKRDPAQPKIPVAFRCSCGKKIVVGPRWIGKQGGCAGCGREFTVRMQRDSFTRRWFPRVSYPSAMPATDAKMSADGHVKWFTVTCKCGRKIGLDARFIGRDIICTACQRHFVVRTHKASDGHDTAKILIKPPPKLRPKKPALRRRSVLPVVDAPAEMHLLCTCGEEWIVGPDLYDGEMLCAQCGTHLHLSLGYNVELRRYELEVLAD